MGIDFINELSKMTLPYDLKYFSSLENLYCQFLKEIQYDVDIQNKEQIINLFSQKLDYLLERLELSQYIIVNLEYSKFFVVPHGINPKEKFKLLDSDKIEKYVKQYKQNNNMLKQAKAYLNHLNPKDKPIDLIHDPDLKNKISIVKNIIEKLNKADSSHTEKRIEVVTYLDDKDTIANLGKTRNKLSIFIKGLLRVFRSINSKTSFKQAWIEGTKTHGTQFYENFKKEYGRLPDPSTKTTKESPTSSSTTANESDVPQEKNTIK